MNILVGFISDIHAIIQFIKVIKMTHQKFMQKFDSWLLRITRITIIVTLSFIVVRSVFELVVMVGGI